MCVAPSGRGRKYEERPLPCRDCGSGAWWNGRRRVSVVRRVTDAIEYLSEVIRRRARCSDKTCRKSWTMYEVDGYPHRQFSLDVVVLAVSAVSLGGATVMAAAGDHGCSRRSVGRWSAWVETIADPADLSRSCNQLDADGWGGDAVRSDTPRAGVVLRQLDRLAEVLAIRGVELPKGSSGLSRVLSHLLARFGEVFTLTGQSPPKRQRLGGNCHVDPPA